MKRAYPVVTIFLWCIRAAAAQDEAAAQKLKVVVSELQDNLRNAKVMAIGGAVMGLPVKGAPYSALEISENTQMLADGNRIHQENRVPVYRDSEGRVRREDGPDQIMIWDPVANVSYMVHPKTQTAQKMPLGMNVAYAAGGVGVGSRTFTIHSVPPGVPPLPPPPPAEMGMQVMTGGKMLQIFKGEGTSAPKTESLGKQTIEGLNAEGTRISSTLEAGAIGNDRPIESVSETWYSPELQTLVKSVHTDPRMGEDTFRLTNVSRAEPPSTLFQVPADYQLVNPKMPGGLTTFSSAMPVGAISVPAAEPPRQ